MVSTRRGPAADRRTRLLVVLLCLLLSVAGWRFWTLLAEARMTADLNSHSTLIGQKIVSNVGPPRLDPFAGLNLTDEQRHRIDDILKANLPPPPDKNEGSGPRYIKVTFPAARIRAVLTPEQRIKFDRQVRSHRVIGPPPAP